MGQVRKPKHLAVLPEDWVLPYIASWRTFERTLNPSFYFNLVCAKCRAHGSPSIQHVYSKKDPDTVIGIQCTSCGNTIKFEHAPSANDRDFPQRLRDKGKSVLVLQPGRQEEVDTELLDAIMELLFP